MSQINNTGRFQSSCNICIVIAFVACCLGLLYHMWIPRGVEVTLRYKVEKPVAVSVLYAPVQKIAWLRTEEKMVENEGELTFFLPTRVIERLRIDLGEKPGPVRLADICVCGKETLKLDPRSFTAKNIKRSVTQAGGIQLESTHNAPYLVYDKPLSMRAGAVRQFQFVPFVLISVSSFGLCILLGNLRRAAPASIPPKAQMLGNVETLRIIFTLIIVLYHYVAFVFLKWSSGNIVEFFFILSGYLLALTYKAERPILQVARQRWVRFVPLVVLGSFLSAGGWDSLYGLFMIHSTGLAMRCVPADPAWYISVLFWCTLFYIGCFKAISSRPRLYLFVGVLTFISSLMYVRFPGDWWAMCFDFIPKGVLRGVSCMGLGILMAAVIKRSDSGIVRPAQRLVYTILEFVLLAYVVSSLFCRPLYIPHWIMRNISIVLLLSVFILKRGWLSQFMEAPVFARLAKYCLAIYLTHWAFMEHNFWVSDNVAASLVIGTLLAIGLGVVCHKYIEGPCARLLNRLVDFMQVPK